MAKKTDPKNVPILPLNTPLLLKAVHRKTMEVFEKKITYKEWIDFEKNENYFYNVYQV
jgi:hypothetical protein